ncbi:DNA internalization-related competence protein ComEC/Rec2 [Virgibacillus doumboii]|uniref:DNA internalization-related competence protein ComEC/Rec2 n=1 Tax=Virgibacillus doumboii TaxID=2697503 RepID=UPI0013E0CD15|nr:DNA internalization-related competence protein ComEC/Rec2 [Virgibacillus doumboii]
MKGYWHFPVLGIVSSVFTVIFHSNWFILCFCLWILILYYTERLGKVVVLLSLTFSFFFFFYIPDLDLHIKETVSDTTQQTKLAGRVVSSINETENKIDFVLKDEHSERKVIIVYFKKDLKKLEHNLKYGSSCTIYGKQELPSTSRNPGQFDYQKYLLSQGITHQVVIDSLDSLDCRGSSSLNKIYSARADLINYVTKRLSPETAAWLNALVIGDDSMLSEDTIELFQRWSLSHILAISGLHVGLIVGLLYFLLIKLNLLTKEKAQWLIIFFLPFYAFLAGGEPSVWRASLMVLVFMIISKSNFKFSVTDVLSIVFIVLIVLDKFIVYSIGFQLSFSVTLGLLLSKNWLAQTNISFLSILKISFVSQMVILPLQITYFSNFQPLSILINVMVVPYFSIFVIPLMFFILLLSPVAGFLIPYIDLFFSHVHQIFLASIDFIDQIGYFPFAIGSIPPFATVLYYGTFLIFMKRMEQANLRQAFMYGCLLTGIIVAVAIRPYFSPVGTITMLDIGQGDAIVVELPYRKGVILIDAGAKMSFGDSEATDQVYKQIIGPYLFSRGIRKIDALIISHEDTDHMGSLPYLLGDIGVQKMFVSNYYDFNEQHAAIVNTSNMQIERVSPNQEIVIGGHPFMVLSPDRDKQSTNENSLVLFTSFGGLSWLFTGDIGKDTETELLSAYPDLMVDVLKVAHHGSNSSTDKQFLKQIRPVYGLISVGINNVYGHPHQEVVTSLKEMGIEILRTDKHGAIQFHFNEDRGTFSTYLP